MSSLPNKIYQKVKSSVSGWVDVDSIVKNEELQVWYNRFRHAGILLLFMNLAYIALYISYKVVVNFTVSSFLFGYFMSTICSISSYISELWNRNQVEFKSILNQNTHILKSVIDGGMSFFMSGNPYVGPIHMTPYVSSTETERRHSITSAPVNTPDNQYESDFSSESDNDEEVASSKNSACIQLGSGTEPVITTNVSLDTSMLEFLLRKREHDEEFMRKMGVVSDNIHHMTHVNNSEVNESREYNDEDFHSEDVDENLELDGVLSGSYEEKDENELREHLETDTQNSLMQSQILQ